MIYCNSHLTCVVKSLIYPKQQRFSLLNCEKPELVVIQDRGNFTIQAAQFAHHDTLFFFITFFKSRSLPARNTSESPNFHIPGSKMYPGPESMNCWCVNSDSYIIYLNCNVDF